MKYVCYFLSLLCFALMAANIWCLVTNQPSTLHLNLIAAIVSGFAGLIVGMAGVTQS